jgi:methionine-rich copper-binding protein CopC
MIRHARNVIAAAAALYLGAAAAAFAHAHLVRTTPSNGEAVKAAPAEVTLTFDKKVEPAFSSAVVRDAAGKAIDKAVGHVDAADPAVIRVSLPPLEPGFYTVEWHAVSTDTHKVNGTFTFRVGE